MVGLDDGDDMQGGVELTVAAGVEAVAPAGSAGGVDGCRAGLAGEVVGVGKPGDVADVAENLRRHDHADAG